jgi:hypothetical protein
MKTRKRGKGKQRGVKFPSTRATRIRGSKKSKAYKAKDFGDNPDIRHSHGEDKQLNVQEPWEIRYAVEVKKAKIVK